MKQAILLALASFILVFQSCTSERSKPNIILISADDLGWSDIGCFGSEINTPNLDKLGEGGMRFTNFHNTSKCFPSRACLITGVYAQQSNYHQTHRNPISNAVTLGEVLKTAGYRTLWSGKHHGLENPYFRGFDRYYGLKDGACNYFNPGNQRPGEGAPARKGKPGSKTVRQWCIDEKTYSPYTPESKDFYTTDYFTNYALDWLEEYKSESNPFFLYLAFTAPHDPLMAWPEDIAKYEGMYSKGYEKIRLERYKKQQETGLTDEAFQLSEPSYQNWEELDDSTRNIEEKKMEIYAAMIDRMDQNIGRILRKLEELGESENTLIMFVSDNGASAENVNIEDDYGELGTLTRWSSLQGNWANVSNTPFRMFKNYSYEGGINTPFIAYWPKKIKSNTISRYPGHFIDVMTTLVDISKAEYPTTFEGQNITPMQGESLLPVFEGETVIRETPLFWEWRRGQAVYSNGYKIVREGLDQAFELYKLDEDPTEMTDLASVQAEKVQELEALFNKWKKSLPDHSK